MFYVLVFYFFGSYRFFLLNKCNKNKIMNRIVTALNYQQLLEIVASKFKVTPHLILSSRRDYQILIARHCFVYFMKKYSALSLNEIGRIVNRTHATVIHARNAFIAEKNVSKSIQQIAHEIEHELLTL